MSVIPMEIDGDDVAHNLGINPSTLLIIKAPFSAICTIVRKAQPLGYDPSSIEDDQRSAMGQGLNIFFNAVASVVEEINLDPDSLHTRFWNRMFKDGKRRKRLVKDTQLLAMVYANKDWLAVVAEAYPVTSPVIREGTFIPAEGIHNQLRKAFDCDYKGSTASNLCRTLEEHYKTKYDPKFDYGRIIAITNSSATGKSRAVHELSKSIPLVSICFRADDEPTSGWPPRDIPAVRFFSDGLPGDFRGEEMAAVFYAAFLTVVTQSLKGKVAPVDPVELMSEWALPSDWYQFVSASNSRHAHFEKLFDVRKQILHDTYSRIKDIRPSNASSAESLFIWYRQLYLDVVHDRRKALAEEHAGWDTKPSL